VGLIVTTLDKLAKICYILSLAVTFSRKKNAIIELPQQGYGKLIG
jgi:hypothetical protein